jgi:hypothetical protein
MYKALTLLTSRAFTTRIVFTAVGTMQVSRVGECQWEVQGTFRTHEQLRMGNLAVLYRLYETLLEFS